MITDFKDLDLSKQYTYADYLTWRFKERVELFRGWVKKMSPAPSRNHQQIVNNINVALYQFLTGTDCKVYVAPFEVLLSRQGADTVVQPDISVICDRSKLTEQGCTGAPDLVIEVLSPGNSSREKKDKFELYEENEVLEYWLVSPMEETILVYDRNEKGKFIGRQPAVAGMTVDSRAVPGFSISVDKAFVE